MWNLDEIMANLSLVYVSGDVEGIEGDKLQLCTVGFDFISKKLLNFY